MQADRSGQEVHGPDPTEGDHIERELYSVMELHGVDADDVGDGADVNESESESEGAVREAFVVD